MRLPRTALQGAARGTHYGSAGRFAKPTTLRRHARWREQTSYNPLHAARCSSPELDPLATVDLCGVVARHQHRVRSGHRGHAGTRSAITRSVDAVVSTSQVAPRQHMPLCCRPWTYYDQSPATCRGVMSQGGGDDGVLQMESRLCTGGTFSRSEVTRPGCFHDARRSASRQPKRASVIGQVAPRQRQRAIRHAWRGASPACAAAGGRGGMGVPGRLYLSYITRLIGCD